MPPLNGDDWILDIGKFWWHKIKYAFQLSKSKSCCSQFWLILTTFGGKPDVVSVLCEFYREVSYIFRTLWKTAFNLIFFLLKDLNNMNFTLRHWHIDLIEKLLYIFNEDEWNIDPAFLFVYCLFKNWRVNDNRTLDNK